MKFRLIILLVAIPFLSYTQEGEIDYAAELAKLELELDSGGIFSLIDSVLNLDFTPPSELHLRFGYNSSVLTAGRDFGLNQHGLTPGITFYHKSGVFSDLTAFWNSEADPKYNLTMASIGYMGTLKKNWNYTFSFEKWFYNESNSTTSNGQPTNNIGTSLGYDIKWLSTSIDYSYLFGDSDAHRIIGSMTGRIYFKNVWFFDYLSIYPTASILFGNNNITVFFDRDLIDDFETTQYIAQNFLNDEDYRMTIRSLLTVQENDAINSILANQRFGRLAKIELIKQIIFNNEDTASYTLSLLDTEDNVFGLMNYGFSLPILLSKGKWSTMISYNYSIPVSLPGDEIEYDPVGFFSASLSYRIPFR